ncbi:MAG: DEAD/DEAH box helicase [Thermosulfidibacteraceae bacterium]
MKELSLRESQKTIIEFLNHSPKKIVAVEAPTGSGKTIAYLKYATTWPGKVIISTFTKALQNQIEREINEYFPELNAVVLKGKNNYLCSDKMKLLSEHEAMLLQQTRPPTRLLDQVKVTSYYCRPQYECPEREVCEYKKILQQALQAKTVIVNHFLLKSFLPKLSESDNTLLIIDECHMLEEALKQKIEVKPEHFNPIEEPCPKGFNTTREYNKALEEYLKHQRIYELVKENGISEPGIYEFTQNIKDELNYTSRTVFVSATLVTDFEIEDQISIGEVLSWENVSITVVDTLYKDPDYEKRLLELIKQKVSEYKKTLILATNNDLLDRIRQAIPDVHTTLEERPFILVEKLKTGQYKAIAGCDTLWTGVDVPGEKCIIMTKLPFPSLFKEEDYEKSILKMTTTFYQGLGRMVRSRYCKGEIFILDRRITKYPSLIERLTLLEQKGAKVTFENSNLLVYQKVA